MSWLKRLTGRREVKSGASINFVYGGASTLVHLEGTPSAAKQSPTCMAAAGWIVQNILEAPVVVERMTPNGWEIDPNALEAAPLTMPLRRSKERFIVIDQTFTQKVQGIVYDMLLEGNAYLLRQDKGSDSEVFQWVPASSVSAVADQGSWARIREYHVTVTGDAKTYQPEDLIHIRFGVDPDKPAMGLAPIAAIGRALLQDAVAAQYMERVLHTGAPSLLVQPEKESQTTFEQLSAAVKAMRDKIKGENSGGIVGMDGSFKLDQVGYTPEQMALDIMATYPQTVICSSLGIPPQVIGIQAGQKTSTYSNMEEANKNAARNALVPIWTIIGDSISSQVFMAEGDAETRIRFDWSDIEALQESQDAQWKRATDAYAKGVIPREWAQKELGFEPAKDGHYSSFDRMPIPLDVIP